MGWGWVGVTWAEVTHRVHEGRGQHIHMFTMRWDLMGGGCVEIYVVSHEPFAKSGGPRGAMNGCR